MKTLSLKQPFAELILQGKKKIELRKWNTKFRGEFFIHASKTPDKESMSKFGFTSLPTGCIVGKAFLKEVKKYKNEAEHKKDKNLHLASSFWGNYGFILENPQRIKEIPCKGALNFWEYQK
ncbi:MAG TPA: ASCH domain-containing protein [Candidatus Nanoarchaeia archaeon]|nr:ASCH domain-containing protein [Candidatus Nanoarchaeia archaeon]